MASNPRSREDGKLSCMDESTAASEIEMVTDLEGVRKIRKAARKKRKMEAVRNVEIDVGSDHLADGRDVGCVGRMKAITEGLVDTVCRDGFDGSVAREVIKYAGKYETMMFELIAEVERLKERVSIYESMGVTGSKIVSEGFVVPAAPATVASPAVRVNPAPRDLPKPVETWSVVVKGKAGGVKSSKEVVRKVVEEVGPTLGVRIHEVRGIRDGGAVIRTPSVAERDRVRKNKKFDEVGLEVSVREKLGPRVVIQGVQPQIGLDEFKGELYDLNFRDCMSREVFDKSVKVVTPEWKPDGGPVNVVLEGTQRAMAVLLNVGRCYVKWFSFRVREWEVVSGCHRCLGFDHRVRECRFKDDVCKRCGEVGHLAVKCGNPVRCRNCTLKGRPAGHMMMSMECPTYAMMVARANARH